MAQHLLTRAGCPKTMVFGPCGGVRSDGRCEVAAHRCPFLDDPAPDVQEVLAAPTPRAGGLLDRMRVGPVVLSDLTVEPFSPASVRSVVAELAPVCDALLVGEHQARPDLPPTQMAAHVVGAGGRLWTTLACRDRNRIVLEQELMGLALAGVDGVLCVTGDGRAPGIRHDATQVFDLDGTRLAGLAATTGLSAAVAESPDSPPVTARPGRVAAKQRAGASLCVLNHVGSRRRVSAFVAEARAAGATLPFLASVAVYTDSRSAGVLQAFPGLHLSPAAVTSVLAAADPVEAGIQAAVAEARELLTVPGVTGINLSGLASDRGDIAGARIKAEVARRVRGLAG